MNGFVEAEFLRRAVRGLGAPTERRHFLLLQGPFGPFFRKLHDALSARGVRVTKIHLNGCDLWDWGLGPKAVFYRGGADEWRAWIRRFMRENAVTDLIVYGDCQTYHRAALEEMRLLGRRTHVFEQGYFRPYWVTLESDGVNAFSRLPRDPDFYRGVSFKEPSREEVRHTGNVTRAGVFKTIYANLALYPYKAFFPRYRNPYFCAPWLQACTHMVRYFRGKLEKRKRMEAIGRLLDDARPFYLALLQRPGDSQLTCHSPIRNVAAFAETAIASFAARAPLGTRLIFKCHPLDPGLENHERAIRALAARYGVADRVAYVDGGILADMLRKASAVITVNSTAGLTAVEFGRPTIALGRAIYDMPGLTFQGELNDFWDRAAPPDAALYQSFRAYVMRSTQINGSFWTPAGISMTVDAAVGRLMGAPTAAEPLANPLPLPQELALPPGTRAAAR